MGSEWVRAISDSPENSILLAEVTLVEVAAAFSAKARTQPSGDSATRDRALGRFLLECDQRFLLFQIDRVVVDRAIDLTQRHRLRGYDAVQLAAALISNELSVARGDAPIVLAAADADLLIAAEREGLAAENPLTHPPSP